MITGSVLGRQATVSLSIFDIQGRELEIEAVVDTGFSGYLTLPMSTISVLSLPFANYMVSRLADGSQRVMEVYNATVLWDEEDREIEVLGAEGDVLVGTSLMDGYDLQIQFTDAGLVTLERL